MQNAFRPMAIRCMHTAVSHAAAMILPPPMDLVAQEHVRAFRDVRTLRERGVQVTRAIRARLRFQHQRNTLKEWSKCLAAPNTPEQ